MMPFHCPHLDRCPATGSWRFDQPPADEFAPLRALIVTGRTVGQSALGRIALAPDALAHLRLSLHAKGLRSMVLATCHRLEVYCEAVSEEDEARVAAVVGGVLGTSVVPEQLAGQRSVEHLFRVCSGLESLIVGEAEVLGQVRAALAASPAAGPLLTGVVHGALRAGRLARAETGIGMGAMSVASAAVVLLSARVALDTARVVVLGAGSTALGVARHLKKLGTHEIVIANRTLARATAVATRVGGRAIALADLPATLGEATALIGAAATASPLAGADLLRAVASQRSGAVPLLAIDLAVPPAISADPIAGIERLDLDTLQRHVVAQQERRLAERPRVEACLAREMTWLRAWARQQMLRPLVGDLRRKVEHIRRAEVERFALEAQDAPGLDPAVLDRLSRRLLDRVLELPITSLRQGSVPIDAAHTHYVRSLFALDPRGEPVR